MGEEDRGEKEWKSIEERKELGKGKVYIGKGGKWKCRKMAPKRTYLAYSDAPGWLPP